MRWSQYHISDNTAASIRRNAINYHLFSGRKLLDFLHLRDKILLPVALVFGFAIGGVVLFLFYSWVNDYTRIGYFRAQVISSMMVQTDKAPPRMRLFIALQSGQKLEAIARNSQLFATKGDVICVEVKQRTGSEKRYGFVVAEARCAELPE